MTNAEQATLRDLLRLTNTVHEDIGDLKADMTSRFDSHDERLRRVEESVTMAKAAAIVAKDIATVREGERISKRWVITTLIAVVTVIEGLVIWGVPIIMDAMAG